jgi:hypothetical protein
VVSCNWYFDVEVRLRWRCDTDAANIVAAFLKQAEVEMVINSAFLTVTPLRCSGQQSWVVRTFLALSLVEHLFWLLSCSLLTLLLCQALSALSISALVSSAADAAANAAETHN